MFNLQHGGRVQNDFIKDFGLFRLIATLQSLGCDARAESRLVAWYWRVTKDSQQLGLWDADTQQEFDVIARNNLLVELRGPSINSGIKRTLRADLRSDQFLRYDRQGREVISTTGLADDAKQDAWAKLFAAAETGGREANFAGRRAGKAVARKTLREIPVSQLNLKDADSGDPDLTAYGIERDKTLPWDKVDLSKPNDLDDEVRRFLQNGQDDLRRRILAQFREENPEDYEFIVSYVARLGGKVVFRLGRIKPLSERGARFTPQERSRAKGILDKLRRIEQQAVDAGW